MFLLVTVIIFKLPVKSFWFFFTVVNKNPELKSLKYL